MPEMTFTVRWPDGLTQRCYSPSLVMHDHLTEGNSYPLDDFVDRSTRALNVAAERVRAKYGFYCTAAAAQIDELRQAGARYAVGDVTVIAMSSKPEVPA